MKKWMVTTPIVAGIAVIICVAIFWGISTYRINDASAKSVINIHPSEPPHLPPSPVGTANIPSAPPTGVSTNAPTAAALPAYLRPEPPSQSPQWKLLDWSVKETPEGETMRAALYAADGKYPYVRVEEIISVDESVGAVSVLRRNEMVGDQVIAKLTDGATPESLRAAVESIGGVLALEPFAPETWLAALPPRLDAVPDAVGALGEKPQTIDYAEPNFLVRPSATPNDPNFINGNQWYLNNTVQIGKDIKAPTAWDSRTDAAGVIVAVIDTGVRYTHEDLAGNMWVNPGEIPGNGNDDDGNGYIDDVYGIDEFSNDVNPMDESGHGTHVAGLVGAVGNNGKGVSGVAWSGVRIMALRFIGQTGSISDNVRCIDYAIANGAKILNASYGSTFLSNVGSNSEAAAIYRAQQAGVLMVAAVGNGGQDSIGDNNDTTPFYPASYTKYIEQVESSRPPRPEISYDLNNIIAVGATDRNDARAGFSNFGINSVDLMAPGVSMWSTTSGSNSSYGSGQGTSFAAPVVSGALALLRASFPNDSLGQLRTKMLAGVDAIPALSNLCFTGGRLDLAKIVPTATPTVLATAWHRPVFREPLLGGTTMRSPAYEVAPGAAFTVFQGLRKFNNPGYGTANQTGGTLFYRSGTSGEWSSEALSDDKDEGDYQFWKATIPGTATAGIVQYYLRLNFDSGVAPVVYLYGNDSASTVTTDEAAARAQPFSLRDRVSWVSHSSADRTAQPGRVIFDARVGYASADGTSYAGANFGALYYTLDGSEPVGSQGNPGNGSTFVVFFNLVGIEPDPSAAGDKMHWRAVVENLPLNAPMRYRIGFWNSATGEEQWGGYNTGGLQPDPAPVLTFTTPAAPPSVLTVQTASNGALNADYTTTKLFIDEVAGDSVPVNITFDPGMTNVAEAEVWTNLNNRNRANADANADGIPDGIIAPPAPNEKPANHTPGTVYPANGYFQAHPMTSGGNGTYTLTLPANRTGAYRLTARYRLNGETTWRWYNSDGRRDHCITVSPKLARDMTVYEINVLNINATGDTFETRSTFEDLTDTNNGRVNLPYLRNLGVNTIWFQPIHPNGVEGREPSGGWDTPTTPYDPGSPYAVKNFFEVMEQMSRGNSRASSMTAFQSFSQAADAAGMHVMLDAPFNHTAYDVELGAKGLELLAAAGLNTTNWLATDKIKDREARFFSRNDGNLAYSGPASSAANAAVAPDRNDFGKWRDVLDVFFGRYATLVTGYPSAELSRQTVNQPLDWINTDDLTGGPGTAGAVTRAVWQYFASYVPHWLEKSGLPAGSSPQEQAFTGVDGLRADFGQGMPPQFWEYCINVARSHKWSFVFMSESLDGGAVTYRSNRHFDILNENIVFPWQVAANTTAHRAIFEDRRNAYGQGLVLLNNTSHDEAGYADPWQAFIRYAVGGAIDGAPMIMYGQEIGTSNLGSFNHYELNFGKFIPHFKRYNSMQPQWNTWSTNSLGVRNLIPAYSGVGLAREMSPALRSSNRWFLNPTGSNNPNEGIFAVAKYESQGVSAAAQDVVLAFVNLDRNTPQGDTFGIPVTLADRLGLLAGRTYNVKNIAAYIGEDGSLDERLGWLWPGGKTRGTIVTNGVYVGLNAVPSTDTAWQNTPFEAQYLKVHDVTPMPAVTTAPQVSYSYTLDGSVGVSWSAVTDTGGLTPVYKVSVLNAQGAEVRSVQTATNSLTIDNLASGQSYTFRITALNPTDPTQEAVAANSVTSPSPASVVVQSLDESGDFDGDGQRNAAEVAAGTDPLSAASVFRATVVRDGSDVVINWTPVPGKTYAVRSRSSLTEDSWQTVASGLTGGVHREAAGEGQRFYQVVVGAPAP